MGSTARVRSDASTSRSPTAVSARWVSLRFEIAWCRRLRSSCLSRSSRRISKIAPLGSALAVAQHEAKEAIRLTGRPRSLLGRGRGHPQFLRRDWTKTS